MAGFFRRATVVATGVAVAGIVALGGSARPSAAVSDFTAPQLASLSFTPGSIDTSGGAATVTVDARITDDVAGPSIGGRVPLSHVDLVGPGGNQRAVAYLSVAQRISGSALDGTYRTTITLPWHAEPGRWNASAVLYDTVANTRSYTTANLQGGGLSDGLTQTGAGDTLAPSLISLQVGPPTIDTALQSSTIGVSARLADDLSGIASGVSSAPSEVILRGPTGAHRVRAPLTIANRTGGDGFDATYVVSVTVPRWSEQGSWTVEEVRLRDEVGNLALATAPGVGFVQTGVGDVAPPRILTFSMLSSSVDVRTTSATVGVRARMVDDRSGVADGITDSASELVFRAPSGQVEAAVAFGLGQRASGNALDGIYDARVTIPAHAEPGTWTIARATAVDRAHNARTFNATEWAAAGFVGSFTVISDAEVWTGPTVPGGGGGSTSLPSPTTSPTATNDTSSTTTTSATGSGSSSTTTSATNVTTSTTTAGGPTSSTTTSVGTPTTAVPISATTSTVANQGGKPTPVKPVSVVDGYWFATAAGVVNGFGGATRVQSMGTAGAPVVGMAATPTGNGYWLVTSAGEVHAFGDARNLGSMAGHPLTLPIVGIASTPTGRGYWLVAEDGGIFSYGDAGFYGSTGAIKLNKPVVGMTATRSGRGYWFVASDGGIFAYGDAAFYGSTGAIALNKPVVGMTAAPSGRGYWLVASDGGIFAFGDAPFYGSTGAIQLAKPIVGMAATPTGRGYWFVASDGGIFAYGDARFYGSLGSNPPSAPVVAMAARVIKR